MRKEMRGEHGQATVEWTALLLLIALALLALSELAPRADGQDLGATLAHSVTATARNAGQAPPPARTAAPPPSRGTPARRLAGTALPRRLAGTALPRRLAGTALPRRLAGTALPRPRALPRMPGSLRRAGRGAGRLWRKAWFACLVYERTRYAFRHPESRIPGYTLPYGTALRMINNCVSPVDLLRDLPDRDPTP